MTLSRFPIDAQIGRLYITSGQSNERYCLPTGCEVGYDGLLLYHLRRHGFERVVFFGHGGCYFLDDLSRRSALAGMDGARPVRPLMHSTGITLHRGRQAVHWANGVWRYPDVAQISQMTPFVKRLLRASRPATAVVFVDLHILTVQHDNTQMRQDFDALIFHMLEQLPTENRNVLIFNIPGIPNEMLQQLGWSRLLNVTSGRRIARQILLGPPERDEIANWLFSLYLRNCLQVTWRDWKPCITLLTSYVKRESRGLAVLRQLVDAGYLRIDLVQRITGDQNISSPHTALDDLVGMRTVKEYLSRKIGSFPGGLSDTVAVTTDVMRLCLPPLNPLLAHVNLNLVLTGNPGTGKTTVCRLLGALYREAGVLPLGHLVKVARQDLVSEYQGQTAIKTRGAIERALGGVLFIDDAYALHQGENDHYGREAIDTLVEAMTELPGRLAVVMAGYPGDMERLMQVNAGLRDRFDAIINIEDYAPDEMVLILNRFFERHPRSLPLEPEFSESIERLCAAIYGNRDEKYANARTLEKLARAMVEKAMVQKHTAIGMRHLPNSYKEFVEKIDVTEAGIMGDLDVLIGLGGVKKSICELMYRIQFEEKKATRHGNKAQVTPGHFIFAGNPGTGKTTVARLLARQFFQMGLVQSPKPHETSAVDLIESHVGETAKKTREFLARGLHKVIFIDEAHQLRASGSIDYRRDALQALVPFAENHRKECIIILAGYEEPIREMLGGDEGLKSRFPNVIQFEDYSAGEMVEIFDSYVRENGMEWPRDICADTLGRYFERLRIVEGRSFANARSVRNYYESCITRHAQATSGLLPDDPALWRLSRELFDS